MELYTTTNRLSMSGDAFFWEGRSSHNSHEMRLSGIPGMGLLISPSLRTYTANIRSSGVQFPCTLACFGSLCPVIPPIFGVGFQDIGFHDAHMIYVGSS